MNNIRNILVATDLSEVSRQAVSRALKLSETNGMKCEVLFVVSKDLTFDLKRLFEGSGQDFERDTIELHTRELNACVKQLLGNRSMDVSTRLRVGKPSHEIAQEAQEIRADLLIMGSHGQGMVRRLLLGSTTMGALHHCTCPVLVIKSAVTEPYQKVALSIDFSDMGQAVVNKAQQIAPDAHYYLVHFEEAPFDEMRRLALVEPEQIKALRQIARDDLTAKLEQLAKASGLSPAQYSIVLRNSAVNQGWLELQKELKLDLLVTGKHGRHATRDRILGSFTQTALAEAVCDVLVVPPVSV